MFSRLDDPSGTAPATIADFDDFVALFAGGIDGLWANTTKDIGVVVNPESYRLAVQTFRDRVIDTGQRGGVSLGGPELRGLRDGEVRAVPGPTSGCRTRRRTSRRRSCTAWAAAAWAPVRECGLQCVPTWAEVGVDDIYSGSGKAERYFTLHVLLGDVLVVQPDAYAQVRLRVST